MTQSKEEIEEKNYIDEIKEMEDSDSEELKIDKKVMNTIPMSPMQNLIEVQRKERTSVRPKNREKIKPWSTSPFAWGLEERRKKKVIINHSSD